MEHIASRNILVSSGKVDKEQKFWTSVLADDPAFDGFPSHFISGDIQNPRYESVRITIDPEAAEKFRAVSGSSLYGMFTILLTGVFYTVYRYTGNTDIMLGTPIFKQEQEGDYANRSLGLRCKVDSVDTFKHFLFKVKDTVGLANENAGYPLEGLIRSVRKLESTPLLPLFDTMVMLDNIQKEEYMLENEYKAGFFFHLEETELVCELRYCSAWYGREGMEKLLAYLNNYYKEVARNPDISLNNLEIMSIEEKDRILKDFNDTSFIYDAEETIHGYFQKQAALCPDRSAVYDDSGGLSYRDLDIQSTRVARFLIGQGISAGSIVGVMLSRSHRLVAALLGILKAGAVCLPLDIRYPQERIKNMLVDSGAHCILADTENLPGLDFPGKILKLDRQILESYDAGPFSLVNDPSAKSAYLIYTSGSEGLPKGVLLSHQGINNHIFTKINELDMRANDKLAHNLSISFVASIWNIFAPLYLGAQVRIYSEEVMMDPVEFFQKMDVDGITQAEVIPSLLNTYLETIEMGNTQAELSRLRRLILTGERINVELVNKFYRRYYIQLINAYGQSECSDDTLHYHIPINTQTKTVPIGRPSFNTQAYVLGDSGQVQPVGVRGELYISGDGLVEGYLNRPELTRQKFIPHPFIPGKKMYRTGDFAMWNSDGMIEFVGRADQQVKLRGYRIEITEIEFRLLQHHAVQDAVVAVKSDPSGNSILCAYLVTKAHVSFEEVRAWLKNQIPDYMIPARYFSLSQLPLSPNGKVNRRALTDMTEAVQSCYEKPETATEQAVAALWGEVLDQDNPGLHDNFFHSGGHSLSATRLITKLNQTLGVKVSLSEIFRNPTLKALSSYIAHEQGSNYKPIPLLDEQEYYNTSPTQKRLYYMQKIEGGSVKYNMPNVIELRGCVKRDSIERAISAVLDRHEILRSSFHFVDGQIVQRVHKHVRLVPGYVELADGGEAEIATLIKSFVMPFDMDTAPLLRVLLVALSKDRYLLVYDMHHIVSDGVSGDILLRDFSELYAGRQLQELPIQYKEYSHWINEQIADAAYKKQEDYWLKVLKGPLPVLHLPADFERPVKQSTEGDNLLFQLDHDTLNALHAIARLTGTTLYMVLLSIYSLLLSKYSDQEELIIGSPIAGRRHPDVEQLMGAFINVLAIRIQLSGKQSFIELLQEVKNTCLLAFENQDYQFEDLVDRLSVQRDAGRNPVFDVMFALHNNRRGSHRLADLEMTSYQSGFHISRYDMTLNAMETPAGLELNFEYSTDLFKRKTVEQFAQHFTRLAKELSSNPRVPVAEIGMLNNWETDQLISVFNQTECITSDMTIHALFQEQANKYPGDTAVICGDHTLTYGELDIVSDRLANELLLGGAGTGQVVAVLLPRSADLLAALLGVLKSGAAYLPLDPDYPEDRIRFMLEDSGAQTVIVEESLRYLVPPGRTRIICMNSITDRTDVVPVPVSCCNSADLAYIIYTSGSTGTPKGVMIEHRAVVNLISGMTDQIDFARGRTILALTTVSFDIFILETLLPLTRGLKVVVANEKEQKSPVHLSAAIVNHKVDMLQMTPSRIQLLLMEECGRAAMQDVKTVLVGGEALQYKVLQKLRQAFSGEVYNMYGPTETTVWSAVKKLNGESSITIGKPIRNTRMYILGREGGLMPIGCPGELYIGGEGLARGYWNRDELTLSSFLPDPFHTGGRMYRTGDLAKWRDDGDIEFMGRADHQIKLRGFRIEPGEIEHSIIQLTAAEEVVIEKIVFQDTENLCAYIVGGHIPEPAEIRSELAQRLPYYMIPHFYIPLAQLPLTPNGKLDRKSLPRVDAGFLPERQISLAESNIEKHILSVWQEVLGREQIGIHDNFFDLGGNSILLITMHSKVDGLYPGALEVTDIFGFPTISRMSRMIEQNISRSGPGVYYTTGLPVQYFTSRNHLAAKSSILRFEPGSGTCAGLRQLSENTVTSLPAILLSLYLYLLAQVNDSNQSGVYAAFGGKHSLAYRMMDLDKHPLTRITDLFLDGDIQDEEYRWPLEQLLQNDPNKPIGQISALFCLNGSMRMTGPVTRFFDLIMEVSIQEPNIQFTLEFNSSRLIPEQVRKLASGYVSLLKHLAQTNAELL